MAGYAIWAIFACSKPQLGGELGQALWRVDALKWSNVDRMRRAPARWSHKDGRHTMSDSEIQITEVCARVAAGLATDGDLHSLLIDLLEPIAQQSQAQAASISVKAAEDGALRQIGAIQLGPAQAGSMRAVQVPLTCRGHTYGQYELELTVGAVLGESTVSFHRILGTLLGLALHDACTERESRQAVLADVHDGIAQTLAFARMRMPLLESAISRHDHAQARRYCDDVRQALGSAHTNLRAILSQGQVPMHPKGLKHALYSSIQTFQAQTQVDLVFDDRAPDLRLSAGQESQVFLIVQEALANIAKHARAQHAWLHIGQQDEQVVVRVEDDGAGPPEPADAESLSHFGMDIMRQRATRLGGGVHVEARAGGGTCMRLTFPANEGATA